MSAKPMQLARCREVPPCGSPVLDRREHRAWHERVYLAAEREPARGPRYVGMDTDEDADQGAVAHGDDVTASDPPGSDAP